MTLMNMTNPAATRKPPRFRFVARFVRPAEPLFREFQRVTLVADGHRLPAKVLRRHAGRVLDVPGPEHTYAPNDPRRTAPVRDGAGLYLLQLEPLGPVPGALVFAHESEMEVR